MPNALKSIVIIGAGGHAPEVAWLLEDINAIAPEWNLIGFVDTQHFGRREYYDYCVLDGYAAVDEICRQPFFVCGMGTPAVRMKEACAAEARGWKAAEPLIHPTVVRGRHSFVGPGTVVFSGSDMGPYVRIDSHCLLNSHVHIGHNSSVGDFSVISPGARVLGGATVGTRVFMGANSVVQMKCKIGDGATLGASSFLQTDLAAGQSALGTPAKVFYRFSGR